MAIVEAGERVHVIERRLFADDVRRHFVGEVVATTEAAIRVEGYLFVYDSSSGKFVRKTELRTRVIPLDNRIILNVLPADLIIEAVHFDHDSEGNLCIVDGESFELDVSEFSSRE